MRLKSSVAVWRNLQGLVQGYESDAEIKTVMDKIALFRRSSCPAGVQQCCTPTRRKIMVERAMGVVQRG